MMPMLFCLVNVLFSLLPCSAISLHQQQPVAVRDTFYTESADSDSAAQDSTLSWPQNLRTSLSLLIKNEMFEHTQMGMYVYDLTADSALFDFGKLQLMRPASVLKLLTSITALANLGGSYQFTTRLYTTGDVKDSILCGDVYIRGGFDPRFGSDDMEAFVEALAEKGLKKINGSIYSDMSLKDTLKWGEGWCWDDDERTLRPLLYNGKDIFMSKFYEKLNENGITHPQTYSEKLIPADSVKLTSERSHTMDQILMRMLKNSDNLYAEALFYQLGAKDGSNYPSAKVSAAKVNNFIRSLGLNPDDYNIADGSGLSLYNYVTPQLIVRALRYAWQRNNIYLHLFPALPVAGVDGTLENRMRSGYAFSNVHAKTGTLRGVSSLAGYATSANDHLICFCILNQGIRSSNAAHRFQDKVCKIITQP